MMLAHSFTHPTSTKLRHQTARVSQLFSRFLTSETGNLQIIDLSVRPFRAGEFPSSSIQMETDAFLVMYLGPPCRVQPTHGTPLAEQFLSTSQTRTRTIRKATGCHRVMPKPSKFRNATSTDASGRQSIKSSPAAPTELWLVHQTATEGLLDREQSPFLHSGRYRIPLGRPLPAVSTHAQQRRKCHGSASRN